jgi:hypothetical protein
VWRAPWLSPTLTELHLHRFVQVPSSALGCNPSTKSHVTWPWRFTSVTFTSYRLPSLQPRVVPPVAGQQSVRTASTCLRGLNFWSCLHSKLYALSSVTSSRHCWWSHPPFQPLAPTTNTRPPAADISLAYTRVSYAPHATYIMCGAQPWRAPLGSFHGDNALQLSSSNDASMEHSCAVNGAQSRRPNKQQRSRHLTSHYSAATGCCCSKAFNRCCML